MKYLSHYIVEKQTRCFEKYGVFFAFSNEQLNEQKQEGVTYVSLGAGTFCPKDNYKAFLAEHENIIDQGIKQDIKENGFRNIIERELANYECYWSGCLDSCIDALEDYNFSHNLIVEVYHDTKHKYL